MNRFALLVLCAAPICLGQGFTVSTIAGAGFSSAPLPAPAVNEGLDDETGVAVDSAGNVYFGGGIDNVVYKISGGILSVAAGQRNRTGYSGDGGPATSALLNNVQGVAVDAAGNLYIADLHNYVIRKVSGGTITTIAGNGTYGPPVNGPATTSPMYDVIGVAADSNGNVYAACGIAGGFLLRIANGTLTIVAGNGLQGTITEGAQATTQPVGSPHFIAADSAGNIYITSQYAGTVIKWNATTGAISTVAGNGNAGYSGDGGPATGASMLPFGVTVDSSGDLFIADTGNGVIREVSNGIIKTVAGGGSAVSCSATAMPATSVALSNPAGIAVGNGDIYFAIPNCIQQLASVASSGPPAIKSGGIVSASAFGSFSSAAPGSWIEIYGSNLAGDTRSWAGADFHGANAPTSLDGTSVTIGGQAAFVDYISPGQVNSQVPSNVALGMQPVIVKAPSGASAAANINVAGTAPGLLAPASFLVGGKQYTAALFSDGQTYVLPPGTIANLPSRVAQPGETIVLYGVGFGAVTPTTPAGQIVSQNNQLASQFAISLGGVPAQVTYAGLAPGFVGLYQFNVVVPALPANNLTTVTFTLGGVAGTQTLFTAVQ